MTEKEIEQITKDWEAFMSRMYLIGYVRFSKALKTQIKPILDSLKYTDNIAVVKGISADLISSLAIQDTMTSFLYLVSDRGARNVAKMYAKYLPEKVEVGVGFGSPRFARDMNEYISTIGSQHVQDITETTRKMVNKALADGLEQGDNIAQVSKRIQSYVLGSNGSGLAGRINVKARALLIARTETLMCVGEAKDLQVDEYPYIMEKRWINGHPKVPRKEHTQASKEKKERDGIWFLYGRKMRYAGDKEGGAENNCNCRCSTVYVPKEDKDGNLIRK